MHVALLLLSPMPIVIFHGTSWGNSEQFAFSFAGALCRARFVSLLLLHGTADIKRVLLTLVHNRRSCTKGTKRTKGFVNAATQLLVPSLCSQRRAEPRVDWPAWAVMDGRWQAAGVDARHIRTRCPTTQADSAASHCFGRGYQCKLQCVRRVTKAIQR